MKTVYFDCGMGAAGDMLTAALLELHPDREGFLERMNSIGLTGVHVTAEPSVKCGIIGTHVSVKVHGVEEEEAMFAHSHEHEHEHLHEHEHEHPHDHNQEHDHSQEHVHAHDHDHEHDHDHAHTHTHTGMKEVTELVCGLQISERVKKDVLAVYQLIAEAESDAHGKPVEEIHFHEVGTMDAVADVTAVCLLMEELGVEKVVCSAVHVGSGQVRCAHGILPVPAPATAYILRGVPIYGGKIRGELCTPTGAALLRYFCSEFGEMPVMRVEKIGYGMGRKDFEAANCVRAMLGETNGGEPCIWELSCNLDDMTPEEIGFATTSLFDAGAVDVFTTAIGMKKNRPGVLLTVLCKEEKLEQVRDAIFHHTTTLGIRGSKKMRYELNRELEHVSTRFGDIAVKKSTGYGVERTKPEYEDLARIAREQGMSVLEVRKLLTKE